MIRTPWSVRTRSRTAHKARSLRSFLNVEQLEARNLLDAAGYDPTRIIVGFVEGEQTITRVIDLPSDVTVTEALEEYRASKDVAFAELDFEVHTAVIPNDTNFSSLYGLNNTGQSSGVADADIDAPEAWDVHTGSSRIAVGVIDTGIDYRHRDLYLNIWINQGEIPTALNVADTDSDGIITFYDLNNSANADKVSDINANGYIDAGDLLNDTRWETGGDNDANGYTDDLIGWDWVNGDNDPLDDNNHGTHVAGTIGAIGDNATGVVGVNWRVRMAALKFLSASGSGAISNATAALNYANGEGIQITNNSWGGGGFSSAMAGAINNARTAGYLFIAAAGNSASNNDAVTSYPSGYNYDNVIAVAATDRFDGLASYSSYGATSVDLGAPGSSILSTTRNNTYSTFNGTSMATPHVAGAAALLWSYDGALTYSEVKARLLNNVDPLPSLAGKVATGGRLNINNALETPPPGDTTGPRVVSASLLGSANAVTGVSVTFSEDIDPTTFTITPDIVSFTRNGTSLSVSAVTPVAGTNNKFNITFATQTTPGTYLLTFGPDIRDTADNPMDQDGDGNPGENPGDQATVQFSIAGTTTTTFTSNTLVSILDVRTVSSTITINQDLTIADLNVRFNITHTWDSDLRLRLRAPNGTTIVLVNRRGEESGDNFTNTTLSDEATTAISTGAAPFSSTYRPEASLTTFDGKNARGTWRLYIDDLAGGDVGRLNSWSLIIESSAGGAGSRSFEESDTPETLTPPPFAAPMSFGETPAFATPATTTVSSSVDTTPSLFVNEPVIERGSEERETLLRSVEDSFSETEERLSERVLDEVFVGSANSADSQDEFEWLTWAEDEDWSHRLNAEELP